MTGHLHRTFKAACDAGSSHRRLEACAATDLWSGCLEEGLATSSQEPAPPTPSTFSPTCGHAERGESSRPTASSTAMAIGGVSKVNVSMLQWCGFLGAQSLVFELCPSEEVGFVGNSRCDTWCRSVLWGRGLPSPRPKPLRARTPALPLLFLRIESDSQTFWSKDIWIFQK